MGLPGKGLMFYRIYLVAACALAFLVRLTMLRSHFAAQIARLSCRISLACAQLFETHLYMFTRLESLVMMNPYETTVRGSQY